MKNIHLIKTEKEYDAVMKRIFEIAESDFKPESKEHDELSILSLLIEEYDRKHYPTDPSDPIEAIKFRMEQQDLRPVDMKEYFGSTGRFYDIINKKRNLSLAMIRKLHEGLGISYESLLA